jgi:Molybdopterin oxidoreductase
MGTRLGVVNLDCRQDGSAFDPSWGRASYLFNATVAGIESADALLLVGTNPRRETAVINARIRKHWRTSRNFPIGLIGAKAPLTYPYDYLGAGPETLADIGRHSFADAMRKAERLLVIVGTDVFARPDGCEEVNDVSRACQRSNSQLAAVSASAPGSRGARRDAFVDTAGGDCRSLLCVPVSFCGKLSLMRRKRTYSRPACSSARASPRRLAMAKSLRRHLRFRASIPSRRRGRWSSGDRRFPSFASPLAMVVAQPRNRKKLSIPPAIFLRSLGLIEAAMRRTTAVFSSAAGAGTSVSSRTEGLPKTSNLIARYLCNSGAPTFNLHSWENQRRKCPRRQRRPARWRSACTVSR